MSLTHNERTKLLATALNNVAVATVVTALIAPAANVLHGTVTPGRGGLWILIGAAWLLTGIIPHLAAQRVLGKLTP